MDTSKIARYVWKGRHDILWYRRAQDLFTELFGADRLELVTKLFAATSINTSLKANITLFRRALHEIDNGLPIGAYMPNIRQQLEQIRAGSELTGRKINSFARSMRGDKDAVVVDIWLLRAFDLDKKYFRVSKSSGEIEQVINDTSQFVLPINDDYYIRGPLTETVKERRGLYRSGGATDGQYTKIEKYVREEAAAMGIEARELGAMIWSGVRIDQSGDRETHYERILRSHFEHLFS